MATVLESHLDSILSTSASIESLSFNDIPTPFIASHHQSGVDSLIRDPLPHERGLFTVQQKENIAPNGESDSRVVRTRQDKPGLGPLLMPKYSAGGNVGADVFLKSADTLLDVYPVPGAKERIFEMLRRHTELTEDVDRLEHLVEEQRKDLETQNSSRLTGIYDEDDGIVVTGEMLEEEEMKVHQLEEKIKSMQDQVNMLHADAT